MDESSGWTSDYRVNLHKKQRSMTLLSNNEFCESLQETTVEMKENISGFSPRKGVQKKSSEKRWECEQVKMEEDETIFNGSSLGHLAESEKSYEVFTGEEEMMEEDYDPSDSPQDDPEVVINPEYLKMPLQNETIGITKRLMNSDMMIPAPPLLTTPKCQGIGSPTKVWSLMVKKDDIPRATRFLLDHHPDMTASMRQTLIGWMMEVCEAEKMHRETFHLAVDYVDRYLESAVDECNMDNFQLIGTAALFIAAKYEEIYPPKCADFSYYTGGVFDQEKIRQMEVLMVKGIDWNFAPITCIQWLSTYLQLLGNGEKTNDEGNMYIPKLLRSQFINMCRILDYLLFEIDSFRFSYRTITAAVLFAHSGCYEDVEKATGFKQLHLQKVIEYVEPVCRVFGKREEATVMPNVEGVADEDQHNIQVYVNPEDIEVLMEQERQKCTRGQQKSSS